MTDFLSRFMANGCVAVFTALTLAACGGGDDDNGGAPTSTSSATPPSILAASSELGNAFGASLNGGQALPVTNTSAQGSGTVVFNSATREMTATVTATGIDATSAQIHLGAPGSAGPAIIALAETAADSGIWTATATLTEPQASALQTGNFYFTVSSPAFPNGEIRGQIVSQQPRAATGTNTGTSGSTPDVPSSLLSITNFLSALRGTQEVPPNTSAAYGSGTVVVNPATRQMVAAITTNGIAANAAHIHEGAPGVAGPVTVPLAQPAPGSGVWFAKVTLTEAQYNALRAGNLYFNVHSTAFPNGEIRGQILPQQQFITGLIDAARTGNFTGLTPAGSAGSTTGTTGATPARLQVSDPIGMIPLPSGFGPTGSTTGTVTIPGSGSTTITGTGTGTTTGR